MNRSLYERFDTPVNRAGTESVKWDIRESFGNADALPMWVADMDFQTADGILDAMRERVNHGIFGYPTDCARDRECVKNWLKTRHACEIQEDWVLSSPGVVDSLYHVLRAIKPEGARIVIQPPVYGPFRSMPEKAKMQVLENPLIEGENGWEMDFDGLEAIFKQGADALILCSPHNPVGRIWKRNELETLAGLCARYGVIIISDEIHADFELRGQKHTPIFAIPGAENAVMLISATKTFNLAALRHSNIVCANAEIRKKIENSLSEAMTDVNLFGKLATRAAYETGEEWLDALIEYLTDGRDILADGLNAIPGIRANRPEGTYLMWVDMRALKMDNEALKRFMIDRCGVIPNEGAFFGRQGEGFVRLNFATTHANLRLAVERIRKAVESL